MFNSAQKKTDLNQISVTGIRAIIILGLLMIAPKSISEIRKSLVMYNIIDDTQPDDILRIDINSLKYMGCEIARPSKNNDYKYVLGKNPFSFNVSEDDIKVIKKVYDGIKKENNVELLLKYHELFIKIAEHIFDSAQKEAFLGISLLKYYEIDNIKDLLNACRQQLELEMDYYIPTSKKTIRKNVYAQKLICRSSKIYLCGFDVFKKEKVMLNLRRIKRIISKKLHNNNIDEGGIKVKFKAVNCGVENFSDEENVLEAFDNGYIVEGCYFNEFIAMQRILSFGSKCTVLEPEDFRGKIIQKIKEMRDVYGK